MQPGRLLDKTADAEPKHLQAIKNIISFNDEKISGWLDISVKTYRAYKKPHSVIKARTKEHAVTPLSLIKHGIKVFGTIENFVSWLEKENFFFDNSADRFYGHQRKT